MHLSRYFVTTIILSLGLALAAFASCDPTIACQDDQSCALGMICQNQECVIGCRTATQCKQGEACRNNLCTTQVCTPGISRSCYDGPSSTKQTGTCRPGQQHCNNQGEWGRCSGQLLPQTEVCDKEDNDCNGQIDDGIPDGCVCPTPGIKRRCYSGPPDTLPSSPTPFVQCKQGTQVCLADNTWDRCQEQRLPSPEICDKQDNDCNGLIDDGLLPSDCATANTEIPSSEPTPTESISTEPIPDTTPNKDSAPNKCTNGEKRDCPNAQGCDPDGSNCKEPCKAGTQTCKNGSWGTCTDAVLPQTEICGNRIDDDCDGKIDGTTDGECKLASQGLFNGLFSQTANKPAQAYAITADSNGNLYITGNFQGKLSFQKAQGTVELQSRDNGFDIFVAKLNKNRQYWDWAIQAGSAEKAPSGETQETGRAIAFNNKFDTLYVAGHTYGKSSFGTIQIDNNNGSGSFIAAISKPVSSNQASWKWVTQIKGQTKLGGLAVDNQDNVFVTGSYKGTTSFNSPNQTNIPPLPPDPSGTPNIFVAKADNKGTWQWATYGGSKDDTSPPHDRGSGIVVDGTNIYITGEVGPNAIFDNKGGTPAKTNSNFGKQDIFVAKLVDGGKQALWSWVREAGSPKDDRSNAIVLNPTNKNLYITGQFRETLEFKKNFIALSLSPSTTSHIFVAQLNPSTSPGTWTKAQSIQNGGENAGNDIASDKYGNIYITGVISGRIFQNNTTTHNFTNQSPNNTGVFVAAYTNKLAPIWGTRLLGANGAAEGFGLVVSGDKIDVTGYQTSALNDGNKEVDVPTKGTSSFFVWSLLFALQK